MRIGTSALAAFFFGVVTAARIYLSATRTFPSSGSFGALTPQTFNEDTGVQTYQFAAATGAGLTWTYSITSGPPGLTLVSSTRTISYDTDTMETVAHQYTIRATDQFGGVIEQDGFVTITPTVPQPLLATATEDTIFLTEDAAMTAYDITQNFTLNGNSGTYAVTGLPTGLSVVSSEIVGTPTVAGTGTIAITFTDSFSRETVSNVAYTVAPAPAIFSNFVWNEAAGVLQFDCTQTGTYTWNFGAANGTFSISAGANSPAIDLTAYAGETRVFTITKDGQELYVDDAFTIPAGLTAPVILDVVISGTNNASTTFLATQPACNAGDLIVGYLLNDNDDAFLAPVTVTKTGETIHIEQAILGDGLNTSVEQTIKAFSYVASGTQIEEPGVLVTLSNADQHRVMMVRLQANTFKDTTPRLGRLTQTSNTTGSAMSSAALSAVQAQAKVFFAANLAFNPSDDAAPAGWTVNQEDGGAIVGFLATRDAATTVGENVSAVQFEGATSNNWIGLTGLFLPKGA